MPLYQYRCDAGHTFEMHGKMDDSDAPGRCPIHIDPESAGSRCAANVKKLISAPSGAFPGADSWRSKNGA